MKAVGGWAVTGGWKCGWGWCWGMGMPLGWSQGQSVRGEPPPPSRFKAIRGGGGSVSTCDPPSSFCRPRQTTWYRGLVPTPPSLFAVRVQAVSKGGRVWPTVNVAPKVRGCVLQWGHWCCPPPPCDMHVAGCGEHLPAWGLRDDRIPGTPSMR